VTESFVHSEYEMWKRKLMVVSQKFKEIEEKKDEGDRC